MKKIKDQFHWETCRHVDRIGQYAVFVKPTCRGADVHCLGGVLVSPKHRCESCRFWEPKGGERI